MFGRIISIQLIREDQVELLREAEERGVEQKEAAFVPKGRLVVECRLRQIASIFPESWKGPWLFASGMSDQ